MTDGLYSIASALIGATATIVAAVIAIRSASNIIKKEIQPFFYSYSDNNHDARLLLKRAQENIVIVVSIGNRFLERYAHTIEEKLKDGVAVYYLLQNTESQQKMDAYIHSSKSESAAAVEHRINVIKQLRNWRKQGIDWSRWNRSNGHHLHVREFDGFLTASYIGIDIPIASILGASTQPTSVIQIMQYQYHVKPKDSPIAFCFPTRDKEQYNTTVRSINDMWDAAKEVPLMNENIYAGPPI